MVTSVPGCNQGTCHLHGNTGNFRWKFKWFTPFCSGELQLFLGGVYMTKLAPTRVLYQDDFLTVAGLAQLVERLTAEREVASSIPGAGPLLRVLK